MLSKKTVRYITVRGYQVQETHSILELYAYMPVRECSCASLAHDAVYYIPDIQLRINGNKTYSLISCEYLQHSAQHLVPQLITTEKTLRKVIQNITIHKRKNKIEITTNEHTAIHYTLNDTHRLIH